MLDELRLRPRQPPGSTASSHRQSFGFRQYLGTLSERGEGAAGVMTPKAREKDGDEKEDRLGGGGRGEVVVDGIVGEDGGPVVAVRGRRASGGWSNAGALDVG